MVSFTVSAKTKSSSVSATISSQSESSLRGSKTFSANVFNVSDVANFEVARYIQHRTISVASISCLTPERNIVNVTETNFRVFGGRLEDNCCCDSCRTLKEDAFLQLIHLLFPSSFDDTLIMVTRVIFAVKYYTNTNRKEHSPSKKIAAILPGTLSSLPSLNVGYKFSWLPLPILWDNKDVLKMQKGSTKILNDFSRSPLQVP
jgi:hypothetical protein